MDNSFSIRPTKGKIKYPIVEFFCKTTIFSGGELHGHHTEIKKLMNWIDRFTGSVWARHRR